MTSPLSALLLLAGLLIPALLAARLRQQALRRQTEAWLSTLHVALELLQRLQQHRGLGGQNSNEAAEKCRQLGEEIGNLWRRCPQDDSGLAELDGQWRALRQTPADFAGHCRLIEQLLNALEQLELRLATRQRRVSGLAQACRELEDLAQLRGLAVRGAQHAHCPLPLQVQMRYLCQRLHADARHPQWYLPLQRLQHELIDAPQVRIRPTDCFALLTPLIDGRLREIHLSLG
ncbi:hypothetical protein HNP49_002137 [Pseudomonas fluvialis]|uniref:Uncharacterized protein n=1 Tax=Pseudomonas fluvialis TaxID=1793966 RepID=A0A7X0BVP2_9PSED|nr:hypothetical protein [Pseudomonas fluvialis]MBB6341969.1 hypothetical protein [Pseudomonas fluvialis]